MQKIKNYILQTWAEDTHLARFKVITIVIALPVALYYVGKFIYTKIKNQ